jgi:predicted TIM-barrel enzyme
VIVGTSLKHEGIVANPVDQARVVALVAAVKGLR